MKPVPESSPHDKLLNAVLIDDEWHALRGTVHSQGLTVLEAARQGRRRRIRLARAACAAAACLLFAAVWYRSVHAPLPHGLDPAVPHQAVGASAGAHFISEQEMLSMFPAGSCVLAEVEGQKQLVFLDAAGAQAGFVLSSRFH